jgi:hypothetical protein
VFKSSTLPLQVTFWIDYKIPSPLERGEGEGEGLKKLDPPHPGLLPRRGEGEMHGQPLCPGIQGIFSEPITIQIPK